MFVRARAGEHVGVMFAHIAAHICSNPVSDILLVHGVSVHFVCARSGNIDSFGLDWWFDSKSKLGYFTLGILHVCWILEVEITEYCVPVGSWGELERSFFFSSHRGSNCHALLPFSLTSWFVGLGSNRILHRCALLPHLILFGVRRSLTNLKVWNW
jgi:hypothetical protein